MQQNRTSPPNKPSLRLVDSSIWIAFYRAEQLHILLRLPNIGLSSAVHGELKRGKDTLPDQVAHLVTEEVGHFELDGEDGLRFRMLAVEFGPPDAGQMLHVKREWDTCLYMRDSRAAREAAATGGDVRTWHRLLDDLEEEGELTKAERERCEAALEAEFARSRRRRR